MRIGIYIGSLAACLCLLPRTGAAGSTGEIGIEKRIDKLLARMTLEEKIGQLSQPVYVRDDQELLTRIEQGLVGSLCITESQIFTPAQRNEIQRIAVEKSRLGIPLLFGFDVVHGFSTIFPTPLGLSASWDEEAARKTAAVAAAEARSYGIDMTFSPMVDVSRDPRWGRISECYGEDVLLNTRFGVAAVRGYQGENLTSPTSIGSCVKHFVGYGMSLGGRDKQFTEISRRSLLETYLPPFEACVRAGAVSVMTAFNDIAGIPASANPFTLRTMLKERWRFDGFTLSDWDAVVELMNHGVAGDEAAAAERAVTAGVDVEMRSATYRNLVRSVKEGRVNICTIDDAVRRVLRIKFRLGLFDRPYVDEAVAMASQLTSEHRAVARRTAAESMVLLKNNGVLPLSSEVKLVSLTGPFALNCDLLGWWTGHGRQSDVVTVAEGIRQGKPASMTVVEGSSARQSVRTTVICIGESGATFGESHNLTDVTLSRSQIEMVREAKAGGSRVVVVLFNGRPLVLTPIMDYADAILVAWHPGVEAGNAVADVLFGRVNPCGKLTSSWPKDSGQIPIYYSDRTSGRPRENRYLNVDGQPLFPFGFGLSYTQFRYGDLRLSSPSVGPQETLTVRVDVTNAGTCDGKEIVQLYIHDRVASVTRPRKQLKDFKKVFIPKGKTVTVEFRLPADELALLDADCRQVVEPGEFDLWVGTNSRDLLHTVFEVK